MSVPDRPRHRDVRRALLTGVVVAGAAFIGVRGALAVSEGVRSGHTRSTLSVAGTLTGVAGASARATFVFRNAAGVSCTPPEVTVRLETDGAFREEVDIERCSSALFDGSDVAVDVQVNGANLITAQPISPVPYARYAEQVGTPDCPVGYERMGAAGALVLCTHGNDQVVRVGTDATAFWIDRYEASTWNGRYGTGGRLTGTYPLPPNGQWTTPAPPMFAASVAGVAPSASITWFQAEEACRASGKRLPTGPEWLTAARGTPDPSPGTGCVTGGAPGQATGRGTTCRSAWGAEDMVGNLWEWTADWQATVQTTTGLDVQQEWPSGYQGDGTFSVTSAVYGVNTGSGKVTGLPAVLVRGGQGGAGDR